MQRAGVRRSIPFSGQSRKFTSGDFEKFDLILAMDRQNLADLKAAMPEHNCRAEIKLFGYFLDEKKTPEVPDPYYGGTGGFEKVLDMVEEGCDQLIEHILTR
jgi:protein-tyrosine phosphatase